MSKLTLVTPNVNLVEKVTRAARNDRVFPLSNIYVAEPWWVRWQLGTNRVVPDKLCRNASKGPHVDVSRKFR